VASSFARPAAQVPETLPCADEVAHGGIGTPRLAACGSPSEAKDEANRCRLSHRMMQSPNTEI
jgi:hypothetical protein